MRDLSSLIQDHIDVVIFIYGLAFFHLVWWFLFNLKKIADMNFQS